MARRSADSRGGLPLYQRIRKALQDELARGTWKPGQMLPTELELSERFGVSPGTIKQAMLGLAREGLIVRQAGKGTFVARLDDSRSLAGFFSFREGRTGEELHPAIRVIDLRVLDGAPAEARKHLRLGRQGKALFARRLLVQDGTPICIYDSFLPYRMVAGLESERLDVDPLYHAIEKRFDIHIVEVEEMLRAEIVGGKEAALLNVPAGSPVIHIERIAFTHNRTAIEWRQTIGRSDHFIYKIKLP
jgi:GntR family transcriptional regulator